MYNYIRAAYNFTGVVIFNFTRTKSRKLISLVVGSVRVYYSVISGHMTDLSAELQEAVANQDFTSGSGYVDVVGGQNSKQLFLNITDDTIPEVQEVFLVNLTGKYDIPVFSQPFPFQRTSYYCVNYFTEFEYLL